MFEGGFLGLDNIGVFDRSAAAAHRRPPRAGRRHGLDGVLLPEHARDRARAATHDPIYEELALKFVEHFFWIAAAMDRVGDRRTSCGTRRTASSTTCCGCPTARPRGSRCARWSGCSRCAPSTVIRREVLERVPAARDAGSRFTRAPPRAARADAPTPSAGRRRPPPALDRSTRPSCAACSRACWTRASSSARTASARSRAATSSIRTSSTSTGRSTGSTTCRPSPTPACSAATRTGAGRSGSR